MNIAVFMVYSMFFMMGLYALLDSIILIHKSMPVKNWPTIMGNIQMLSNTLSIHVNPPGNRKAPSSSAVRSTTYSTLIILANPFQPMLGQCPRSTS